MELINPECEKNKRENLNSYLLRQILGDPRSEIQQDENGLEGSRHGLNRQGERGIEGI
jgi:hypothetical protein